MSFRWRRGRLSASVSRRGPRAGYRLGCTLPVLILLLGATGCIIGAPSRDTVRSLEPGTRTDCNLAWDDMSQVEMCRDGDAYRLLGSHGNQVDIVVRDDDPDVIAAALADAFLANEDLAEEIVVWAWSKPAAVGSGYDRGVVSEQGMLGELLVFEICSAWEPLRGPSDLCTEKIEFEVEQ